MIIIKCESCSVEIQYKDFTIYKEFVELKNDIYKYCISCYKLKGVK